MRRLFLSLAAILSLAVPAAAQRTVVTGTITDVNGLPYARGTIQASLTLPLGASGATLNGVQISGATQRTTLDDTGSFLMQLPDNNVVQPPGTKWIFAVNISPGIPPPAGTGPQSCNSATLTITGASQSVTASFSACPKLSNTSGGAPVSSLPGGNAFYLAASCPASTPNCFVAPPDVQIALGSTFTTAVNNGSPNIQVGQAGFFCDGGATACAAGQTSSIGKRVKANTGCCNTTVFSTPAPSVVSPSTTISSVTDGTHAVMSANAIGTCTANCAIAIGTDSTTQLAALNAAVAAAVGKCPTVHWPSGFIFTTIGLLNTPNASCASVASDGWNGVSVIGEGMTSSGVVPLDFDYTTGSGNSCGGTNPQSGGFTTCMFAAVANLFNFEFWGLYDGPVTARNAILVSHATRTGNTGWINVNMMDWLGPDTTTIGFVPGFITTISNVNVIGFGGVNVRGGGPTGQPVIWVGGTIGNSPGNCLQVQGNLTTIGLSFGQSNTSCVVSAGSGANWNDYNSLVYGSQAPTTLISWINTSGGTASMRGTRALNPGVGAFNGLFCDNTGTCKIQDSQFQGGTTNVAVACISGSKIFDLGANTVLDGGGGRASAACANQVFGDGSITGTALIAGNVVPSANWGTGATITAPLGDSRENSFTLTNGSAAVGANPTLTYTFPTPFFWGRPSKCVITQTGGTQAQIVNEWSVGVPTTTSVVFTYNGTPTINLTEFIAVSCH